MAACGPFQRLHVLGKTRATVTGARVNEMVTDTRIGADALAHEFHVGTDPLGDIGDLIHETDLGCQHRVGGVLGQLGRTLVHHHHPVVTAVERRVQAAQHRHRALA